MAFQRISVSDLYIWNIWKGLIPLISFSLGDMEKPCVLTLVDDSLYEEEEEMRLVLGSATSDSPYGASVGTNNETLIKIKDSADSKRQKENAVLFSFLLYNVWKNSVSDLAWICKFLQELEGTVFQHFSTFNALNQNDHDISKWHK